MEAERPLADSSAPKGRDTGKLSAILKSNIDKQEGRVASEEKAKRRSKPEREEKPTEAAGDGQAKIEAHSDDGKKLEPKRDGAKEPASKAKKDAPAPEAEDNSFAPKTWTEAARKAFDESPPDVQKELSALVKNLQGGFTKKTMALAEDQKIASEVRASIQPHHRELLRSHGISEGRALGELLNLYDGVRNDPRSFILRLMQRNRIDPASLGFAAPQNGEGAQPEPTGQAHQDPVVAQLQAKLASLEGVLTQAHNQHQQTAKQKEDAAIAETHGGIVSFINEVDETGMPTHPHWDTVQAHVLMIAKNDPELANLPPMEKLQAAYDRAVWANPAARAAALDAERAKQTAEIERNRTRAARTVKPSGGASGGAKAGKMTLDDIIRKNAKKHNLS